MAAEIVAEKDEVETMENMVKVLERQEARIKFEAEERRRMAEVRKKVEAMRLEEKERAALVKSENEARIDEVKRHCELRKKDARSRLLKPTTTTETVETKLNPFRRAGATAIAVNNKSFGGAFAAVVSGKLGESILKDMKIHRVEQVEARLRGEAQKSVTVGAYIAKMELEPTKRERLGVDKRLKEMRLRVQASSQLLDTCGQPHSPLLCRRPVTAEPYGATSPLGATSAPRPSTSSGQRGITAASR
jgi:hypothetical protein